MKTLLTALEAIDGQTAKITYTEDYKAFTVDTTGEPKGKAKQICLDGWESETDYYLLQEALMQLGLNNYIEMEKYKDKVAIRIYEENNERK